MPLKVISFAAGIHGGQWQRVMLLLDGMRRGALSLDVISCSAAISACQKGGQWQRVVALLDGMRRRGLSPNAISFSAAIS
eukprot:8866682-Karenia_brevis.AAC.1